MPLKSGNLPPELKSQLQLLIAANHILHHHGLVDAFGHISIRHPLEPSNYIIASYNPGAPALISSFADFIEYRVSDSEPVDNDAPRGYSERYIHGEIYKRYAEVNCVVHSHSEAVIPFMASGMQPQPVFHMAGFLGPTGPPTLDLTATYAAMRKQGVEYVADMLIKTPLLGSKLAAKFSLEWNGVGWTRSEQPQTLRNVVVLQYKHGFTCVADGIQNAVYRAIYTQKNCKLQLDTIALNRHVGSPMGVIDSVDIGYLTEEECKGCARMNEMTADKAFRLWLREVEVNPLYKNEEGVPTDLPVGGMKD